MHTDIDVYVRKNSLCVVTEPIIMSVSVLIYECCTWCTKAVRDDDIASRGRSTCRSLIRAAARVQRLDCVHRLIRCCLRKKLYDQLRHRPQGLVRMCLLPRQRSLWHASGSYNASNRQYTSTGPVKFLQLCLQYHPQTFIWSMTCLIALHFTCQATKCSRI